MVQLIAINVVFSVKIVVYHKIIAQYAMVIEELVMDHNQYHRVFVNMENLMMALIFIAKVFF